MTDPKKPDGGLMCEFNGVSAALTGPQGLIARSDDLGISLLDRAFGVRHDFTGTSVTPSELPDGAPKSLQMDEMFRNRAQPDGFHVGVKSATGGDCDVELKDGSKYNNIPMKRVPNGAPVGLPPRR